MPRETLDLTGPWQFQPDPFRQGQSAGYSKAALDARRWRGVRVPCAFDDCMPGLRSYEGCGWFTRRIDVPDSWRGRHVDLRFEGVNTKAEAWVNGQLVGSHDDGYLRFDLPATGTLRYGQPNTITVKVDSTRVDGEVPGLKRGWRPFGGILREVSLIATDPLRIAHVSTRAEADGEFEQVIEVTNGRGESVEMCAAVSIRNKRGIEMARFNTDSINLAAGEAAQFRAAGAVADIEPWSPESPTLYHTDVRVLAGGKEADRRTLRIGFRTVHTKGTKLLLNARPLFLTGFNRHEDSPRTGMCPDIEIVRKDLETMKRIGCNFVRLCHYPHHPSTLDLCDELGLLAMCEIPLYWWSQSRQKDGQTFDRTLAAAKRQLESLIRRDINHPSVIFWSVSNENDESIPDVVEGNRELLDLARKLDRSRPAVHVSNHWHDHPHFDADDVICINDYPTWWQMYSVSEKPVNFAESTRIWRKELAGLHKRFGGKPILVTEFGGLSFEGVFGLAGGEDYHAKAIEAEFAGMQAAHVCGATIWCWADHPWPEGGWIGNVTTSPFGVVTRDRKPLAPFYAAEKFFTAKRKEHMKQ